MLIVELEIQLPGNAVEFAEAALEGVMKAVEVIPVFHLICEDITGSALACNMEDLDAAIVDPFTGAVVPKLQMSHILHGCSVGPIDGSFIVIVN